jgi:hypothetical protein
MSADDTPSDDSRRRDLRFFAAFFLAPLTVPLLLLPLLLYGKLAPFWVGVAFVIAAVVSYAGTLLFSMPAYFVLRRWGYTSIWIAITVGSVIGAIMWLVFAVLFTLSLDQGIAGLQYALSGEFTLMGFLWPGGGLGAVVGAVLWMIARPDRQGS